jgi:hypothetical protein
LQPASSVIPSSQWQRKIASQICGGQVWQVPPSGGGGGLLPGPWWSQQASLQVGGPKQPNSCSVPSPQVQIDSAWHPRDGQSVWHMPASSRPASVKGPPWPQQASPHVGGPTQPKSWSVPSAHSQTAMARQARGGQLVWHCPPVLLPPPVLADPPVVVVGAPPVVTAVPPLLVEALPPVVAPAVVPPPPGLVEQAITAAASAKPRKTLMTASFTLPGGRFLSKHVARFAPDHRGHGLTKRRPEPWL